MDFALLSEEMKDVSKIFSLFFCENAFIYKRNRIYWI